MLKLVSALTMGVTVHGTSIEVNYDGSMRSARGNDFLQADLDEDSSLLEEADDDQEGDESSFRVTQKAETEEQEDDDESESEEQEDDDEPQTEDASMVEEEIGTEVDIRAQMEAQKLSAGVGYAYDQCPDGWGRPPAENRSQCEGGKCNRMGIGYSYTSGTCKQCEAKCKADSKCKIYECIKGHTGCIMHGVAKLTANYPSWTVCTKPSPQGQHCTKGKPDFKCQAGGFCQPNNTCGPKTNVPAGGYCEAKSWCAASAPHCRNHKCEADAKEGESCASKKCANPMFCTGDHKKCSYKTDNGWCDKSDKCTEGHFCNDQSHRCSKPSNVNGWCNNDAHCKAGLHCYTPGKKCASTHVGDWCMNTSQCDAKMHCGSDHKCQLPSGCAKHSDCPAIYMCIVGACAPKVSCTHTDYKAGEYTGWPVYEACRKLKKSAIANKKVTSSCADIDSKPSEKASCTKLKPKSECDDSKVPAGHPPPDGMGKGTWYGKDTSGNLCIAPKYIRVRGDEAGNGFWHYKDMTAKECAKKCDEHKDCNSYEFNPYKTAFPDFANGKKGQCNMNHGQLPPVVDDYKNQAFCMKLKPPADNGHGGEKLCVGP